MRASRLLSLCGVLLFPAGARVNAIGPVRAPFARPGYCAHRDSTQTASDTAHSPDPAAVLGAWFAHIQREELDSLRPLLTPDFLFVTDGTRMGPDAFVAMIESLGIRHPRVQLSNVVTHRADRVAYLVYDRTESFEARGVAKTVPETGTMVLVRRGSRWLIAQWAATSPPR